MATTFVGGNSTLVTSGTAISTTTHANSLSGDMLVAAFSTNNASATHTTPANWVLVSSGTSSYGRTSIYYRFNPSSVGGVSYQFNSNTSTGHILHLLTLRGALYVNPGSFSTTNVASYTGAVSFLLWFGHVYTSATLTPAGMTLAAPTQYTSAGTNMALNSAYQSVTETNPSRSVTAGYAGYETILLSIKGEISLPYTQSFETFPTITHEADGGSSTPTHTSGGAAHGTYYMRQTNMVGSHRIRFDSMDFPTGTTNVYLSAYARCNGASNPWGGGGVPYMSMPFGVSLYNETNATSLDTSYVSWNAGELSSTGSTSPSAWQQRMRAFTVDQVKEYSFRVYNDPYSGAKLNDHDFFYLATNVAPGAATIPAIDQANNVRPIFTSSVTSGKGAGAEYLAAQFDIQKFSFGVGWVAHATQTSAYSYGDSAHTYSYTSNLPIGNYIVRARTIDGAGVVGSYSGYSYFTVGTPPSQPTNLTPGQSVTPPASASIAWTHNDTEPQVRYQIRWRKVE